MTPPVPARPPGFDAAATVEAVLQAFEQSGPSSVLAPGDHPSGWVVVAVNQQFADLLGGTLEQVRTIDPATYSFPEDLVEELALAEACIRGERDGYRYRKRYRRLDGSVVWVEVHVHAVRNADGSFAYWVTNARDITAERELELEVARQRAEVDRLLAVQTLVGELNARLIDADADQLDLAVQETLGAIAEHLGVVLALLAVPDDDGTGLVVTHGWARGSAAPPTAGFRMPGMLDGPGVARGEVIRAGTLDDLPPHLDRLRAALRESGIRSVLGVPVVQAGTLRAVVAFGCLRERDWPEGIDAPLRILADSVARALDARRLERAVRASEARYRHLVENLPMHISRLDANGVCTYVNETGAAALGRTPQELIGKSLEDFGLTFSASVQARALFEEILATGRPREGEMAIPLAGGSRLWFEGRIVRDPDPNQRAVLALLLPVTARKRAEAALSHQLLHDQLTGLPNRALLARTLQDFLDEQARDGNPVTVIEFDVQRLRAVNDGFGHATGDAVLTEVAARLDRVTPPPERCARVGGDEFAAVYTDVADLDAAVRLSERLCEALRGPLRVGEDEIGVSVSAGVAQSGPGDTAESLLHAAATALHAAQGGQRGVAAFTESLGQRVTRRRAIERDLRRAVEAGELSVYYQPEWRADGRLEGVEGLVRWLSLDLGPVRPDEFLPIAEETGLIGAVGELVLTDAATHAARWRRHQPDLVVWVNLSARELAHPEVVATVLRAASSAGIQDGGLGIEVTERSLIDDLDAAAMLLARLRDEAGVRAAVDDFGTGYSSLAMLQRLPLAGVKIDRSFVGGVTNRPADRSIVAAVVAMAHQLGLRCIAEGVEQPGQLDTLHRMGIDVFQGYLLGRPAPAEEIEALVTGEPHPLLAARIARGRAGARSS